MTDVNYSRRENQNWTSDLPAKRRAKVKANDELVALKGVGTAARLSIAFIHLGHPDFELLQETKMREAYTEKGVDSDGRNQTGREQAGIPHFNPNTRPTIYPSMLGTGPLEGAGMAAPLA